MRISHSTVKVPVPTWLGSPQVMVKMAMPDARMASSCHRIVCTACTKRVQPLAPWLATTLRGPVTQPVRKLSSCQPHSSSAQVKAQ